MKIKINLAIQTNIQSVPSLSGHVGLIDIYLKEAATNVEIFIRVLCNFLKSTARFTFDAITIAKLMHKLTSILLLLFLITAVQSQAQSTVKYEKGFGGYKFFQGGNTLTPKAMVEMYKDVPEAATLMQQAKSNYNFSLVLGYAGGFLVGFPLGTALGGGDPQWTMAGIGAGIILMAIPGSKNFAKKAIEATDIYNGTIEESKSSAFHFKIGPNSSGYGLTFNF